MDLIDPRTHTIHPMIDGEHLAAEKAWANQPFKFWPHQFLNALIVIVLAGALFAAYWAANAAAGIPA